MAVEIEQSTSSLGWDLINDLSGLPENEDIIIDYLLERLQRGEIYTWVGSLLLALHPCNEVSTSEIYGFSKFDKYLNAHSINREEAIPHIFTVAAKAHYNLTKDFGRNCQVIIISGETGTGKTFNAYKCLEFLSAINKTSSTPCQEDYSSNITTKITDTCRLISAFTTACTEKNEVSSRHGQLVRLHYKGGAISGATINSFLLERSRVTKNGNNFQIFYQMLHGMSDAELETFGLFRDEDYDILSTIDSTKKKYFENNFQETAKAFDMIGFEADRQKCIYEVLALLVHMGNIKFVDDDEVCAVDLADRRSKEALKNTCILSSLNEEDIIKLLTTILIYPQSNWRKHTACHRNLINVEACRNRLHSIIRHIYDLLFHCILEHANNALSAKNQCLNWLGILDIFGFELFTQNNIEQLCVNYANEKMQQYFMETSVENKRKDLQEESLINNEKPLHIISVYKERLNVIEDTLFSTLNDACCSPIATDASTMIQFVCGNYRNAKKRYLSEKGGKFIIEHYSGPVAYSITDLISKNADKVPTEISITFNMSQNKFLRSLINSSADKYLNSIKTSTKKRTMLAKLKYNMDVLIKELNTCDLHYVRCIKPSRSIDRKWDRRNFQKQLACTGIFDALSLAKCRYPIRLSYEDFCRRYSKKITETYNLKKCQAIVESIRAKKQLSTLVHYGKRLIFLTESMFFELESYRRNYRVKCANKIKSFWKKYRRKKTLVSTNLTVEKLQDNLIEDNDITESKLELKSETSWNSVNENVSIEVLNEKDDVLINYQTDTEEINRENMLENGDKRNHFEIRCNLERKSPTVKNFQQNWLKMRGDYKMKSEDLYVSSCLKNIAEFINKTESKSSLIFKYSQDVSDWTNDNDIPCQITNNNNYLNLYQSGHESLNDSTTNKQSKEKYKRKCIVHYDKENKMYAISLEAGTLFYKNKILSRRRLNAMPIRMHTRPTCLQYSHVLPRCEFPRGLEDCL